ncbi:helix-turn-helix transcriptional regulator [Microscilla marina]|uniref:HTH cro/C1-type domain-containing protein n=1 Tax=Microscilla marina ATCC 23134 TaxID=313606 RepID=A1ZIT1_MICM2|nr:helix-turn-helix transcriptional regulator [Microscilla marina]EAY29949.1 hypothetical protein M23134_05822 [Microscilla marina ATCC 23134]
MGIDIGFKERLLKIIQDLGYNRKTFAEEIDVPITSVYQYIREKSAIKPSLNFFIKFLDRFPNVNGNWLLTGQGTPLLSMDGSRSNQSGLVKNLREQVLTQQTLIDTLFQENTYLKSELDAVKRANENSGTQIKG